MLSLRSRAARRAAGWTSGASVVVLGLFALLVLSGSAAAEAALCAQAPVVCENELPGSPASEWDVAGSGDSGIQGFATDLSVDNGSTVRFKVDTTASDYRLDIYRLGYYGGLGARKVATVEPSATLPQLQPACLTQASTGLVDCGNWAESASWAVPADAVSGIYIAKLVIEPSGGASHIPFVVRDDDRNSELLFQTSDTTWQAYNSYGGASLYSGNGPGPAGRAHKVSYNRPFNTRSGSTEDYLFNSEYPMLRWLERNGYDVTYSTDIDTDRFGAELLQHKAFLSVGHDEYWSAGQRAAVENARNAGVHLAFFSGNEIYWKTRWEASIDASGTPYRTLVTYKEGSSGELFCGSKCDPVADVWTGLWRSGCEFSPPADGCRPENALSGQMSWQGSTLAIQVPAADGKLRLWRNTSVASLAPGQVATLAGGTLGYEWDFEQAEESYPPGRVWLSSTTSGDKTHHLSLYRHGSGSLVFGAGTVQWMWGLDGNHDRGGSIEDTRIQQATVNLLADMGSQPATLQSGLSAAAASTDTTAPASTISSPADGSTVTSGASFEISGTATDAGGGAVGAVEVSVDGGATWRRADGRGTWTFDWTPGALGSVTIKSRATDDSGNIQSPVTSSTVTVEPRACPCSLWSGSEMAPDPGDSNPVELGVRFRSDIDGFVSGIRFLKAPANTGTHVGKLYAAASKTLLGTVTFTGETASGWQEAHFDSPIAITANETYVASYHTPSGHYAFTANYFGQGYDNPPLHAFSTTDPQGPNGVYRYGAAPGGFPEETFNAANYWVDVVFVTSTGPDATPPVVASTSPANGATGVQVTANVTATFNEAMNAASITEDTFVLRDAASSEVAATVSYDAATRTARLDPVAELSHSATYTATVEGGDGGVRDVAGNELAADRTFSFTTAAPPPPPPDDGPGGPVLVISRATNPFTRYYAEILRTEGLNEFTVKDVSTVSAATLAAHDVVVLGEMPLTAAQVTMLTDWVNGGGNLIAMRPDKQLAGLLGLSDAFSTLGDAYLRVNTTAAPGTGIVPESIQFHGAADRYTLNGATSVATLFSDAATTTLNPAVTLRTVGTNGGQASAWTFDLARSVVLTRQGNPAWAGQERDGIGPIRSDDLFFGGSERDWVDLGKVAIPQADEQQRLLANLIQHMNRDRKPLPRFWYFPRDEQAVVVMTGDDHGNNGTPGRFDAHKAQSPAGCSVADWECVRASSYIYPSQALTNAQAAAYTADGFEIGVHVDTGCGDWTPTTLESYYANQLGAFGQKYTSVPAPSTNRTHCIVWSDWASQPKVELAHGIRLDTNYYYWPPGWVQNRPGMFTGSGMPMRFADLDGTMIDVYQATSQMTDESGQTYPFTIDTLLDRAQGPTGYYGAFTANMHTDSAVHAGSDAIVASAQARSVPVVSGRQMLEWLDGRNASSFGSLSWSGNTLSFTIDAPAGARGLRAMVPTQSSVGALTGVARGGTSVFTTTKTVKGVEYAVFEATSGSYTATYAVDSTAPAITDVAAAVSGTSATVTWSTSEPGDSRVVYGTSPGALGTTASDEALVNSHSLVLSGLAPSTTYYYRVSSRDAAGNTATEPQPASPPRSFTTPTAGVVDTTAAHFAAGTTGADTYVAETADGEVTLAPTAGSEFSGSSLPGGWSTTAWSGGGSGTVGNGTLTVDGARTGTDATFGPGRSLEFVATFSATAGFQHVGFGLSYEGAPWAIFSTSGGGALWARTNGGASSETPLGAASLGALHRFRIDWGSTAVTYFIDGVQVAQHAVAIGGPMRPLASDFTVGGDSVKVDWMRMSGYPASGVFTSRVLDPGEQGTWGVLSYVADTPAATSVSLNVRTGDTPTPDGSWSAFAPVAQGGNVGASARYVQYQATLTTTDPSRTPALERVELAFAAGDRTPPTIIDRSPAAGATGAARDANVTVTFSEPMDGASITSSTFRLRAQGAASDVPANVSYAGRTATLDPVGDLATGTVYEATVAGTVEDAAGNALGQDESWTFTTAARACPCSLWTDATTPGTPAFTPDTQAVELGVKFEAVESGYVTALRFYKGATNTGVHRGFLYSAGGTLLASATYVNETASGWQQVELSNPVAISAGTTYIASYHAPNGNYAHDGGYFESPYLNPPLKATGSAYRYGAPGSVPTTNVTSNYWVDLVFTTTPPIDGTPPLVVGRSPAPDATDVDVGTNVTVDFSEAMDPSSIDGSSFRLRAQGAAGDVAAAVSYAGQRATLDPNAALAPGTTYVATVADTVRDSAGNRLVSPVSWSFTTGSAALEDTTVGDFSAGTLGSCAAVAHTGNGEVTLAPELGTEFDGTGIPAGWKAFLWHTNGTASVGGGVLTLNGARAVTNTLLQRGTGRSVEFVATFAAAPFQHAGFAGGNDEPPSETFATGPWAIFSTGAGGTQLQSRTLGSTGPIDQNLGADLIGSPHRFRIDWLPGRVQFWVDGVLRATHLVDLAGQMRPAAGDFTVDAPLTVDWVRMSPYASSCTFASRIFDAGMSADWQELRAGIDTPTGTTITFETRSGSSATPGAGWSDWAAVSGNAIASPNNRYIQYRAVLSTLDSVVTPELRDVRLTYAAGPANRPPTAGTVSIAPASPTTDETLTATTSGFSDPDGDPLAYAYQWFKNGSAIAGATSSTLNLATAGNGDRGDTIRVEVSASDGQGGSAGPVSDEVTVANSAPTVRAVSLSPLSPKTNAVLTATADGLADRDDGDTPTLTYVWKVNGVAKKTTTGTQSLTDTFDLSQPGHGDKGQTVTVEVTPNDGTADGAPASASVTVANTAPAATVTLSDNSPATNDTLTATATTSDADGDSVRLTYVWKVDGAVKKTTSNTASLTDSFDLSQPGNGDRGQTVTVEVTPNDGEASGATASAGATVANSSPRVTLSGNDVVAEGTTHTYSFTASDDDGDSLAVTSTDCGPGNEGTTAFDPGTGQGSVECAFLDGDAAGDVSVSVSDGHGGTATDTQPVAVKNVAPSTPTLVAPADGAETSDSTPTFDWSDSTDPGTDAVRYRIQANRGACDFSGALELDAADLSASTFTPTTALADGTYCWSVRSTDEDGASSDYSTTRTLTVDTVRPNTTITFPVDGGTYNGDGWNGGCGSAAGDICGTAADPAPGSGVAKVEVSIRQTSSGLYWNGATFASATELFVATAGTSSWSYSFTPPADGQYTIHSRATDDAGNVETSFGTATFNEVSFTSDTVAPGVRIDQATGQADPTNTSPIRFTAVFSERVSGFDGGDVTVGGTAGGTKAVTVTDSGDGKTYDVAVSGMGDGTVIASVDAGKARDAAGNANTASTSTDNSVRYDVTKPGVSVEQAATQTDPARTLPIRFRAAFTEPVSGFTASDVTIGGSAPGTPNVTVSDQGDGKLYEISVSGFTAGGTVTASIDAGKAQDAAGNTNTPSTSTDNSVVYDPDTDGDNVVDSKDNCVTTPNPGQENNDGDAQGDACDPDDDNDTVADTSDNCVFTANPDQKDTDRDGKGDACDPTFNSTPCTTSGIGSISTVRSFSLGVDWFAGSTSGVGNISYTDRTSGATKNFKSTKVTGLVCWGSAGSRQATIVGTGTVNSTQSVTFEVNLADYGTGKKDTLAITWWSPTYSASGTLRSGDIAITPR